MKRTGAAEEGTEGIHQTGEQPLPRWAKAIRDTYTSGTASVFLLHGVRDRYRYEDRYLSLPEFVHHAFCAEKTTVLFDISRGVNFRDTESENEFDAYLRIRRREGDGEPTDGQLFDPSVVIPLLEDFLYTRDDVAIIIDYVDKVAPRERLEFMSLKQRRLVTTLRRWASDPRLLRRNSFVFLISGSLADVNEELYVRSSRTELVELPMPSSAERRQFINYRLAHSDDPSPKLQMERDVLGDVTNGLALTQIGALLRGAARQNRPVTHELAAQWKRKAIETEIGDLVEFANPRFGLEAIAGVEKQKNILLQTARALRTGRRQVVPKGIMLTGPPGCGKTFCMECFAHDCGIPFVRLKNVYSKYVGATESNLEKLFHYLEALSPVFVFIDEFDQSYGRRVTHDTDSGVSRRVFAMFNAFLSDERHQGKVLFGAATNRPDLIDPSTLRAGRFDLKLPFLLPDDAAREAIFKIILKTLNIQHNIDDFSQMVKATNNYSGADIQEIIQIAQRRAAFDDRRGVTKEDLQFAVDDYIPPVTGNSDQIRLMELLAVRSCTSRQLLPDKYITALEDGSLQKELRRLQGRVRF